MISSNTVAISTEASTRASADTALQNAIDAEAATRGTADAGLQSQIDAIELDYVERDSDVLVQRKHTQIKKQIYIKRFQLHMLMHKTLL